MITTIKDLTRQLEQFREKGIVRGIATGFKSLDDLYSVKYGSYTIVYSEPTHGKSEFIFELCLNQTHFGKRSLICSPETGTVEEIIAELIHKYTGKSIFKNNQNHYAEILSDLDFYNAIAFLDHNFVIVDTDAKAYSVQELFDYADQWETENPDQKIDIIVGEPYNELKHDMTLFGARQDLYIEDLMSNIRRECRRKKRHFFLSIHPSGSAVPITKDGITYYPKPLPRQAAGGQALYRKAMTWITLWRPPVGLCDETGFAYKDNEVHVFIDKAKPKGVSFKGRLTLYFYWVRNRYFEGDPIAPLYAFDHLKRGAAEIAVDPKGNFVLKPNLQFESNKEDLF